MNFGFPIHELEDSPKEKFTIGGAQITRRFLIPWDRRLEFTALMIDGQTGVRVGPARYSPFPPAIVDSIEHAPFSKKPDKFDMTDPAMQVNNFTGSVASDECNCLTVVTYVASPRNSQTGDPDKEQVDLPEGTYVSYRRRSTGEYMTVPGRGLEWSAGVPVGQDTHATIRIPLVEHIVTWHRVKYPPWQAIDENTGKVIGFTTKLPGHGRIYQLDTLLFEGGESDREFQIGLNATETWQMTYTFKERRVTSLRPGVASATIIGWNHLYRPETGDWSRPFVQGTSADPKYMYDKIPDLDEFKKLFRFEQSPIT